MQLLKRTRVTHRHRGLNNHQRFTSEGKRIIYNDINRAGIELIRVGVVIRGCRDYNKICAGIQGDEIGKVLGTAIASNTTLESLDLSSNFIKAGFAREFAVGLGANGALEILVLNENAIKLEGAKLIVKALHVS